MKKDKPGKARDWSKDGLTKAAACTILAAEGFASLSVEVLGLRAMVPYAGTPVPVTSILLAAYLGALAIGYYRGQRLAERLGLGSDAPQKLRKAAGWRLATAGLWTVGATGDPVPTILFSVVGTNVTLGVIAYSTLAIAPIGMWLAESILLVDRARAGRARGGSTGTTLAMSTAGNVAGALLTAWAILAWWGMAGGTAVVCLLLGMAAMIAHPKSVGIPGAAFVALTLALYAYNDQASYIARTAYADYRIVDADNSDSRELLINNSRASKDDPNGVGHGYIETIEQALCAAGKRKVAVLGAAGRTLGRGADCELEATFVDLDPWQRELAGELLHGPAAGEMTAQDARVWLRNNGVRWPAIVADAYSHGNSLPTHLATIEMFSALRDRLEANGLAFINILSLKDDERLRTRIDRTIRRVFSDCETWSQKAQSDPTEWAADDNGQVDNLLYRCRRSAYDGDTTVYSDRLERIDQDRGLR